MKANAPEKIYIVIDPIWGSMSVNYNRNDTNNIEYTRTDAFIEKACEWLKENLDRYTVMSVYDEVTEIKPKLVKNFIKAMKL